MMLPGKFAKKWAWNRCTRATKSVSRNKLRLLTGTCSSTAHGVACSSTSTCAKWPFVSDRDTRRAVVNCPGRGVSVRGVVRASAARLRQRGLRRRARRSARTS
eukprot:6189341-Pleurochrysis_carterae.AAC.4